MSETFKIINDLNVGKQSDDLTDYNAWLTNKHFSLFSDTVLLAQAMNISHSLPANVQHAFYLNIIKPRKRFSKWPKSVKDKFYDAVKSHYQFSDKKTRQAMAVLSDEQLAIIQKQQKQKGE